MIRRNDPDIPNGFFWTIALIVIVLGILLGAAFGQQPGDRVELFSEEIVYEADAMAAGVVTVQWACGYPLDETAGDPRLELFVVYAGNAPGLYQAKYPVDRTANTQTIRVEDNHTYIIVSANYLYPAATPTPAPNRRKTARKNPKLKARAVSKPKILRAIPVKAKP